MAITWLSTELVTNLANSDNTDTVDIPSGATLCIIAAMYWLADPGYSSCTLSLDGETPNVIYFDAFHASRVSCTMWEVTGFSTGSGKNFSYDFDGTTDPAEGIAWLFIFFSGTETSSPIRDYDVAYNNTNTPTDMYTPTIDSSDTDMMVAAASGFSTAVDMTGDSQTERITPGAYRSAQYDCATVAGSDSGKTMTAYSRNSRLIGASIKAAAGGISLPVLMAQYRQRWR